MNRSERDKLYSKARNTLRNKYPMEHRAYYMECIGEYGRLNGETPNEYSKRLIRAYSVAVSKLIAAHKEDFKLIIKELRDV